MAGSDYDVVEELLRRIERLEARVYELENKPIPIYDPIKPIKPETQHCSKCGLVFDKTMGYVCNRPDCPTGLGGTWCNVD